MKQLLTLAGVLVVLTAGMGAAQAQERQGGWANMDPQEMQRMMQQRMMEFFRDRLAVTNDAEWQVIEKRITKVSEIRMQQLFSGGIGMFGGMRSGGNGGQRAGRMGGMGAFAAMAQPSPEAEALQKAIEADAPTAEIRAKLERHREARRKQANELAKAQEDLRQVLSLRQEATLVVIGLLD